MPGARSTRPSVHHAGRTLLWRYLRDELGVSEVTPADVLAMVTPDFLAAQSDEWITRFYAFLYQSSALWQAAGFPDDQPGPTRTRPIIRLEDGRHVAPFDALGHPLCTSREPAAPACPRSGVAARDEPRHDAEGRYQAYG